MLERIAMLLIVSGVAAMSQPFWAGGFRIGFFVTLGATILFIVASHLAATPQERR